MSRHVHAFCSVRSLRRHDASEERKGQRAAIHVGKMKTIPATTTVHVGWDASLRCLLCRYLQADRSR